MQVNPIEPRNTIMRVASASDIVKPASLPGSTTQRQGTLRGQREQRDGTDLLGTWESPRSAPGVSRAQPGLTRINKREDCCGEVGGAHSSEEAGESRKSEGALAIVKLTGRSPELIGK